MSIVVERATQVDLDTVLTLFDSVQRWLVARGLKEQWDDEPFSENEVQRRRFATWLSAGHFSVVRDAERTIGTLVFSPKPPDYAQEYIFSVRAGPLASGYLEAFAVHRDYAGRGVGKALLSWAKHEAARRGLDIIRLDCWAENEVLRVYYRRAGFSEVAPLTLGSWRGVLKDSLKLLRLSLGQLLAQKRHHVLRTRPPA